MTCQEIFGNFINISEPIDTSTSKASKQLAPTQKDEIVKMATGALAKILDNF